MSLATACGVTVLRSFCISLIGVFLARRLTPLARKGFETRSFLLLILILSPLLVPELLVGYAWSLISVRFVQYPVIIELIYSLLILMKVVPVGVICFSLVGGSLISPEADFIRKTFCAAGSRLGTLKTQANFFLWQTLRVWIPVWALLFLLSFQEFEMASLMYRDSWTVWIFDAQAGGVPVRETLSYLIGPLSIEVVILLGVFSLLQRFQKSAEKVQAVDHSPVEKQTTSYLSWGYLVSAFTLIVLVPFLLIGWGSARSMLSLLNNQFQLVSVLQECAWALAYGATSSIAAWGIAAFFLKQNSIKITRLAGLFCCLPGLCGALILALVLASLFLTQAGSPLYGTPIPVLLGFVLFLFPRALFLRLMFLKRQQHSGLFLAQLLRQSPHKSQSNQGGELLWSTYGRMQFWAVVLLAFWAYWDVTISSILAPGSTMTSSVRLYGLMHYGQNAMLSAITFFCFLVPVCFSLALVPIVKKFWISTYRVPA
ncbi:hypothetical protein Pan153_07470 [Gimesia panareensis]|uniref:ABC transmembrane type-1 domain-containing protein n=1 Tax=Gimesia panareensis TaxID=2527978 RepID=A0A518FIF1_9PLAN|nr:hypothetical protein [Gimesia panareensis]QDV16126.1 hypothetical protein Pan153_07470 [Gimesia panareensis]